MSIPVKDSKILWSKASGRCSMRACRKKLIVAASDAVPSRNTIVGECCHIIAERKAGPRGNSILSIKDRNRYPNLILLCLEHHSVIDADPAAWPVELLHQIKADHELWVETQLTDATSTISDQFYSQLVNAATDGLMLEAWDGIGDNAVRGILFQAFLEGSDSFCERVFRACWTGEKPNLEETLKNLANRLSDFTSHFLSRAYPRNDSVWVEDKRWKKESISIKKRLEMQDESTLWQRRSADLLMNVVVALNEFAAAVRSELNASYFALQGKFTLHDSLGVTNRTHPVHYLPERYVEPRLE